MKRKGFTLIELLAVIVILAIIALIVTPIVSDIIESSKKAAAKRSIEGYISAANNAAAVSLININGINVTNEKYSFETGEDNEALSKVDISGKKPSYVYLEYDYQLLRVVLANFCYNGYAFDYDNGVIEDGAIDYCSVSFTDRPKVVITGEGELNSRVTITINYTENTVGKQYKIGNGEYSDYTEPFEIESSKELASQRDEHGNLKICAKATLVSGESTEICRGINKLDLDYPADPVIEANIEYPLMKISGISIGALDITYAQGDDVKNYVSFDGVNWNEYTGSETVIGSTIYAKSVKLSGLTSMSTKVVSSSTAANALPPEAYNGDTTDSVPAGTYYLKLDDSVKGKEFEILWYYYNTSCKPSFGYLDIDKKSIGSDTNISKKNDHENINKYTISEDAEYIKIKFPSASYCTLREIRMVNLPEITSDSYDYPVWKSDGSVVYDDVYVNINYNSATSQKLYKIDDGEWTTYTEAVLVPMNSTVYAKSIFADGMESLVSSFTAAPFAKALPAEAYNGDTTDSVPVGTYYLKLDDSVKGKEFEILWYYYNTSCKPSFGYLDIDKKSIGSDTNISKKNDHENINKYTISEDATYIKIKFPSVSYCTLREIRLVNQ